MAKKKSVAKKRGRQATPPRKKQKAASTAKKKKVRKPASKTPTRRTSAGKSAPKQKSPASLQSEINRLDRDILKLINARAEATTKLIESQPNPQETLYDPHADDALWEELRSANQGPLTNQSVRSVYRELLSAARRHVKTQRVAYLGPPFSYTHLAAMERFGNWADLIPVSTIASVFEEVNRGHADYGLVPIENSTDGRVVDTLDMFTRLPLRICGEVQISVHHNLLARCPRSEITEIYSKPQALSQCREWLQRNMPQTRLIEVTSTSTAAQLARDKHGAAAIASQQAAVEYELQFIAENIEDNTNNVTRFAVIGDDATKPTGRDRTAIVLQIPHKPGSLGDALSTFKKNKINLTWIESFPLRGPEVGYLFFLDFEGHIDEARCKRAVQELEKKAVRLEILGSYPRSEPLD